MSPRLRGTLAIGVAALLLLALTLARLATATIRAPRPPSPVDVWDGGAGDHVEGRRAFASCASCHLADGSGRSDGSIPRLAGQRAAVLRSKLRRLATGEVQLPVMTGFAASLTSDEIDAIADHLADLPSPPGGPGDGAALQRGESLYAGFCAPCHGLGGGGDDELLAPRLCGQHPGYLLRRMSEINAGTRADADLTMAALVGALGASDRSAIADFLSREPCNSEAQ